MALSVNGQNELNPNRRWRCLVPSGLPAVFRKKVFFFYIRNSISTKREVKMAGYWPHSFFFLSRVVMDLDSVTVNKHPKKELG